MIQELIKKQLDERLSGNDIPDADLKAFYDTHIDDFVKPERARVYHILLPAKDAKEKAAARKHAEALLKDIQERTKRGEVNAFQAVAQKESKDATSAPMGGDLRFVSKEELTKNYSAELANASECHCVDLATASACVCVDLVIASVCRTVDFSRLACTARTPRPTTSPITKPRQ